MLARNMDPSEIAMLHFERAASKGCVLELRMRLLAGLVPELKRHATARRLEDTEDAIIAAFTAALDEEESELLRSARRLRNKVLHCDFSKARAGLEGLGHTPRGDGAIGLDLNTGETTAVRGSTTANGQVYGWLIELWMGGDFDAAHDVFEKASALVLRLRDHWSASLLAARKTESTH